MARLASAVKMGYYPTPTTSLQYISRWIENKETENGIEGNFHYLDPCCGEGHALKKLVYWRGYDTTTWGIELDAERAMLATENIEHIIQCSIFDARVNPLGSVGLLYLNPPYDTEKGERTEMKFLKHSLKWLCPDGVLVFVVPEYIIPKNIEWIGEHFYDITIVRLHRDDYPQFKQVVLFAKNRGQRVQEGEPVALPPYKHIEDVEPKTYYVPPTEGPSVFQGSMTVTDEEIRKYRPQLVKKIKETLSNDNEEIKTLSPLLPLRKGHLVSLITAGILDGKVENPNGSFIIVKGFSERVSYAMVEDDKKITKDTYSVGIRVMEENGEWYDIH